MQVADFDYHLPEELIAQEPLEKRDHSRLLVLERRDKTIHHCRFPEIVDWLQPGDLMVFNDTRVIPARLWGRRQPGGGRIEVLLLKALSEDKWEALVRPGRKIHQGQRLCFGPEGQLEAITEERTLYGGRVLCFKQKGAVLRGLLTEVGEVPLPHYIKVPLRNKERYQTIYSREEGSVAAPTAGLHFTPELMEKIKAQGVKIGYLTLHVGLGTFRPVKTKLVEEHQMHAEYFQVSEELAQEVAAVKKAGRRVIAVGTTSARTLETIALEDGRIKAGAGWTDIFIYPGYKFKVLDGLVTNFHLPCSTLLMLVAAFTDRELILAAYEEAVKERYRFFSFGDAMLIL
ncbi:MAG TPA: tRNA preQ1(34) S-adenosylmethionine ribosyltransferase-isomerase QueA [Firmicutes bacterium]|nr:tRNA preQ1(34) S-adenosylmethionine ribosyltransferase-isomerase QueA [Bacillota bacterium]HBT16767.1 tRNA preQ1(34) S-adenosylmethionine ribosyltransferase-isomerase QueA [Bacillota bacterium]